MKIVINGETVKTSGGVGFPGADGKSAYDVAVELGFEGTEAEWIASLKGDKGEPGEQGPQGPAGAGAEITPGVGLTLDDDILSVITPVRKILTQDEFDALMPEQQARGMYIVDDGNSTAPCQEIYSTEEQCIGRWIDGRPLYSYTYAAPEPIAIDNNWATIFDAGALNIERVVYFGGTLVFEPGRIDKSLNTRIYDLRYNHTDGTVQIFYANATSLHELVITIKYTKQSDTPTTIPTESQTIMYEGEDLE